MGMRIVRRGPVVFLGASMAAVIPGYALAEGPLPASPSSSSAIHIPGRHVDDRGRTWQANCPAELAGPGRAHCLSHRLIPSTSGPLAPFSVTNGLGGDQIAPIYGIPASAASGGAIVAIIDANGDGSALADTNTYRTQYGLGPIAACAGTLPPDAGSGAPCLAVVNGTGGTSLPPDDAGWASETALDLEMVSAACPDCNILLVQVESASGPALAAGVTYAASVPGVVAITNSYATSEAGPMSGFDPALNSFYNHPGILVLAGSGDWGYLDEGQGGTGPSFPASSPYVLAVGGTTVSKNASNPRGWNEAVWNAGGSGSTLQATGSGCSLTFAQPSYQTGVVSCCSMRDTNDLAAAADSALSGINGGAINIYCTACSGSTTGKWEQVVGTSASSPMVAGLLARLGLATTLANDKSWPYTHMSQFNDIVSGTDDPTHACKNAQCTATPGWDGPTGVGTPNGAWLLDGPPADAGAPVDDGLPCMPASSSSSSGSSSGSSGSGSCSSSGSSSGATGSSSGSDSGSGSGSSSGGAEADASVTVDASIDGPGPSNAASGGGGSSGGCGCYAVATDAPSAAAGLLALGGVALALSRRRRGL